MTVEERVLIAGAGPVGLVAAANLVRHGVPVTVLEAGPDLSEESRASTFHPPTLDMLKALGAAQPLIAQGLSAPQFQYRTKQHGILAQFDFGAIADVTGHPYRLQCEQSKLTRILREQLRGNPDFELHFGAQVQGVSQDQSGVEVAIERNGRIETRSGRWLIGADGAGSNVRRSLGIAFDGFTWPERFLVVSTPFDFMPSSRSGCGDLHRRSAALALSAADPRALPRDVPDRRPRKRRAGAEPRLCAVAHGHGGAGHLELRGRACHALQGASAGGADVSLRRTFLAGDAAHINNPLGGMGMNGGIHDAINLTSRLVEVWHGTKAEAELERYDRQRRLVTLEYIEKQSIQNKRNLESDGTEFRRNLAEIAADRPRTHEYLLRVSMIASLRRAQELG